jgi:hypothetical protein
MSFHPFAGISEGDAASRPRFPCSLARPAVEAWRPSFGGRAGFALSAGAVRSTIKATATSPSVAAISQAPREEPVLLPPFILVIIISAKVIALDAHLFLFRWCICSRPTSMQTPTRVMTRERSPSAMAFF